MFWQRWRMTSLQVSHRLWLLRRLCLCALALAALHSGGVTPGEAEEAELVRDALTARLQRLGNVAMKYRETTRYSPPFGLAKHPVLAFDGKTAVIDTGSEEVDKEFWCLDGMIRYEAQLVNRDRGVDLGISLLEDVLTIHAMSKDRVEALRGLQGRNDFLGEIRGLRGMPRCEDVEIGLGRALRGHRTERVDDELLASMSLEPADSEQPVLSMTDAKGVTHEFVLSRELGYAPVRYVRRVPPDNHVNERIEMSEFRSVDGVMLPYAMDMQVIWRDNGRDQVTVSKHIAVHEYRLDAPENVPERYQIEWPENTYLLDTRTGVAFRIKEGERRRIIIDSDIFDQIVKDMEGLVPDLPSVEDPGGGGQSRTVDVGEASEGHAAPSAERPGGQLGKGPGARASGVAASMLIRVGLPALLLSALGLGVLSIYLRWRSGKRHTDGA